MGSLAARVVPRPHVPTVSRSRRRAALALAATSDALQWALFPVTVEGALSPVEIAIDAGTALVLLLVLGFRWRLAFALALELVPGVDLFPTWTAVVLSMQTAPDEAESSQPARA